MAKTIIIEDNALTIPSNTIITKLSNDSQWLRWFCECGSGGVTSMYDGNVEDLYAEIAVHNTITHRGKFNVVDRI